MFSVAIHPIRVSRTRIEMCFDRSSRVPCLLSLPSRRARNSRPPMAVYKHCSISILYCELAMYPISSQLSHRVFPNAQHFSRENYTRETRALLRGMAILYDGPDVLQIRAFEGELDSQRMVHLRTVSFLLSFSYSSPSKLQPSFSVLVEARYSLEGVT